MLAPECRALHATHRVVDGHVTVEATSNPITRFVLWLFGFPTKSGETHISFVNKPHGETDTWERHIHGRVLESKLSIHNNALREDLFVLTALSQLEPNQGGLDLVDMRFRFFGLPVPRWASPSVVARERPKDGGYGFDIEIETPWRSRLVRYHGVLETL